MTVYPARLEFDLTDDETAGAVVEAALDLQLPFEMDGQRATETRIVVVVDSPMTAYRFGSRTQELRRKAR